MIELFAREPRSPASEPIGNHGGIYKHDRLATLAEREAISVPGDFCEIGCYSGGFTIRLATLARRYGRRVIAIDPFPAGTPYRLAEEVRAGFQAAITPWPEIEWHQIDGNDSVAVTQAIAGRRLCFGFADATKEHEDVRAQLAGLMPACDGLIVVDDAYVSAVLRACDEMARERPGWVHLRLSRVSETYLLRSTP
ncbi:MAG: class I SAM-dependent methyltransferase [bacterium]|nr:class I SAM-dependent methyltransferase [bacterium]